MFIIQHYLNAMRKYARFSGYATRSEFWAFMLANVGVWCSFWGIGSLGLATPIIGVLLLAWFIIHLLPTLATTSRRLHDAGYSATWLVLYLLLQSLAYAGGAVYCASILDVDTVSKTGITPEMISGDLLKGGYVYMSISGLLALGFVILLCLPTKPREETLSQTYNN